MCLCDARNWFSCETFWQEIKAQTLSRWCLLSRDLLLRLFKHISGVHKTSIVFMTVQWMCCKDCLRASTYMSTSIECMVPFQVIKRFKYFALWVCSYKRIASVWNSNKKLLARTLQFMMMMLNKISIMMAVCCLFAADDALNTQYVWFYDTHLSCF